MSGAGSARVREVVYCALDSWDDVWIRNQPIVDALLRRLPDLRVLFVEPPSDPLHRLANGRIPQRPYLRALRPDGRLHALRPLKVLPRRAGPLSDRLLLEQVRIAAMRRGFRSPILVVNDVTYAPLIELTDWSSVYDISDDWLLAPFSAREIARLTRLDSLALAQAGQVVVCSPGLASTRGRSREVRLIPNAVDVTGFQRPQPRPVDLPRGQTAVYVGTLHEARLDVALVLDVARAIDSATVVLVGPDALTHASRRILASQPNVIQLGSRPHAAIPGYLQHADVVIVPHLVNPFTESLDPVKAYECAAISTPTVATPVAGFRELSALLRVAPRETFVSAVRTAMGTGRSAVGPSASVPTWHDRAASYETVLAEAVRRRVSVGTTED